ncbi:DUF4123 domain-containing protein [Massilia sp. X63]|uniref:DUF4123 domain-containing protein n=1 Tax=Massilia sp. X63 TaxID=3237285 RepID=UPI0034DCDDB3
MLTDPFIGTWLDTLRLRFRERPAAHELHLLIDGAFVPGLHRHLAASSKALLFYGLPGSGPHTLDVSPFVLRFDPASREVEAVLRKCLAWPMVNVIETPEAWQGLAARLAAWCVIEADGQRFNFRFADTRRLPAILKTLDQTQRRQFSGPAVSWSYIARDGDWRTRALDGSGQAVASAPRLDDAQFGALVEDSRVDEILTRVAPGPDRDTFLPSKAHALIASALASASKASLSDSALVDWCEWLWARRAKDDIGNMAELLEMWKTRALSDGGR